jgi:hypothetical protein
MEDMTQKELKKLIDKAEISTAEHGKQKHVNVLIPGLDREIRFASVKDDDDAKQKTLDFIVAEPPHIRGFALDTDKSAEE